MVLRARAVLAVALLLAACGGRGPRGPVVSPTGIVYPPGVPPVPTRFSEPGALYLREDRPERALELALEGLAADSTNPAHWFVAGVAHARLGQYEEADHKLAEAQRLYPAYELDTEPERESAWTEAFNRGTAAYEIGDLEGALTAWRQATRIFDLRPEAHRNLATLLTAQGRRTEAIEVYLAAMEGLARRPATRVLTDDEVRARDSLALRTEETMALLLLAESRFSEAEPILRRRVEREPGGVEARRDLAAALFGLGRSDEAEAIHQALLGEPDLGPDDLLELGVAFFRASDYRRAAEAFSRISALLPESRDAWFNRANALLAAEEWGPLVSVGERLAELDPLGENAALIVARARLENGDPEGALAWIERAEGLPVHLTELRLVPGAGRTRLLGRVVGNAAAPGTPVRIRVTFQGEDGNPAGEADVTVAAPAPGERSDLDVAVASPARSYRYSWEP